MDENVMRVLQMLQDGKITAQEAETLIAALRGETSVASEKAAEKESKPERSFFGGFDFDKIKPPKLDLDDLGERISKAVARVQPEKIVKRVQAQLRTASRSGVLWSTTVSARVRTWSEGRDRRPENTGELPQRTEDAEQEFHLEPGAWIGVDNPLGDIRVDASATGPAVVVIHKTAWTEHEEHLKAALDQMEVSMHGTDSRLDIKVSAPDTFHTGVVDIVIRAPKNVSARLSTHFGSVDLTGIEGRSEAVTTVGDLRLHDLSGDVRGETASGDLRLERITGQAHVATQSGDIYAEDIQQGLTANTASGEVNAKRVEGGRVECKSVSGDVRVEKAGLENPLDITVESVSGDATLVEAHGNIAIKAVSGEIKAEQLTAARLQAQTVSGEVDLKLSAPFSGAMQVSTVSGEVSLTIPEGSNVRVSLGTTSGEMKCDHNAQDVTASDTFWTGQIGTGAGTLNVQTISGDAHIHRA